ncbi:unnamed protein product [Pedinophyceae sp. YPF-701]|nr:unnamed protein product [Pedinophyceae sp. YPF-701]
MQARARSWVQREVEVPELLIGDVLAIVVFALWRQLASIALAPDFPGWLAPLAFNPGRFVELANFVATLAGTWAAASLILGGYRRESLTSVPKMLQTTCQVWLVALPVALAWLLVSVLAENGALVGEPLTTSLPLALRGPMEPAGIAAGMLGLMAAWRSWYTLYLGDPWGSPWETEVWRQSSAGFVRAVQVALVIAVACLMGLEYFEKVLIGQAL